MSNRADLLARSVLENLNAERRAWVEDEAKRHNVEPLEFLKHYAIAVIGRHKVSREFLFID